MGQRLVTRPKRVVERNMELTAEAMGELLARPALLEQMPHGFRLVVLPEDDPGLWLYNLDLLHASDESDQPVVFARMATSREGAGVETSFYAPIVA